MQNTDEKLATAGYAELMWNKFTKDEKNLVRYGMFPADRMRAAEADGYGGKDLAVALMDQAKKHGGMIA